MSNWLLILLGIVAVITIFFFMKKRGGGGVMNSITGSSNSAEVAQVTQSGKTERTVIRKDAAVAKKAEGTNKVRARQGGRTERKTIKRAFRGRKGRKELQKIYAADQAANRQVEAAA